jgi:hypothetical protein
MGGFAFTRDTQPSAIKFGMELMFTPSRVTGIGYINTFAE